MKDIESNCLIGREKEREKERWREVRRERERERVCVCVREGIEAVRKKRRRIRRN